MNWFDNANIHSYYGPFKFVIIFQNDVVRTGYKPMQSA